MPTAEPIVRRVCRIDEDADGNQIFIDENGEVVRKEYIFCSADFFNQKDNLVAAVQNVIIYLKPKLSRFNPPFSIAFIFLVPSSAGMLK